MMLMMTRRKPNPAESCDDLRLLTFEQVCAMTQLSENTIRTMIAEGEFPRFVKLGRSTRFRYRDIRVWLLEQFGK